LGNGGVKLPERKKYGADRTDSQGVHAPILTFHEIMPVHFFSLVINFERTNNSKNISINFVLSQCGQS
jgi:hypothetical protein